METNKNIQLPDFLIIPSQLVIDNELRPTDLLIYGIIYWFAKLKLEKCILSNRSFCQLLNVSERAVQYGLQRMSDKGYIECVYADPDKRVRKELIPLVTYAQMNVLEVNKNAPPLRQMFTPSRTNVHQNKIIKKEDSNNTSNIGEVEAKAVLDYWNELYGTRFKSPTAIQANLAHWLSVYTLEEMKEAIRKIKFDKFWKDKMTPTMLFRKKNPRGENVDQIGAMLNVKESKEFENSNLSKYDNL